MIKETIKFIKDIYPGQDFIPLHAPLFNGNEKKYLEACVDSTFVSSVGKFVTEAEEKFAEKAGVKYAVAAVNGTSALHLALNVAGVSNGDEVLTQPLTFVATCNAILYQNAHPVFIDISTQTLSLSAKKLGEFLSDSVMIQNGQAYNKKSGRRIRACLPMHTFGHPAELTEIKALCDAYNIILIEDAAEAVGSYYKGKHLGGVGDISAFSFNGNKIITCGGGGMVVTNNPEMAKKAKHLSTVAKIPHPYEFYHDEVGYNYRMPNINAALLVAQLEQLDDFVSKKRSIAHQYANFFAHMKEVQFVSEPIHSSSNYWLNAILLSDLKLRDAFLEESNKHGVMTRPAWKLMPELPAFKDFEVASIACSRSVADRLVCLPSSVND